MLIVGTIPETLENNLGECLEARTLCLPSFRSLGPPDLVQLTKATKTRESSTYYFLTGVDVSGGAAIAAYMNTITFPLGEEQLWFGRHPQWKIVSGTFCSWNAFAHVDVRVNVKIPGSVEAYTIDVQGERQDVSDQFWLETYMSAMVRALILVDHDIYFVSCSRHDDPIPTKESVLSFFQAFESLFMQGPLLGARPQAQPAGLSKNYMVDAFFEVVKISALYSEARAVLGRLAHKFEEAHVLLARLLLLASNEVKAVKLMVDTVCENPRNADMLALEARFCLEKGETDLALDCALRAISAAPAEFYTWEILTKVYIAKEDYEQALLTLNSSPLVPSAPIDTHRMPSPKKVHSPLPTDGSIEEIWDVDTSLGNDAADPSLLRLPATGLKGSSLSAYNLLAAIFTQVGWAKLMAIRGNVFLMEVEAKTSPQKPAQTLAEAETEIETAVQSRSSPQSGSVLAEGSEAQNGNHTETTRSAEPVEGADQVPETSSETRAETGTETAQQPAEQTGEHTEPPREPADAPATKRSIRSKRLCERRLDSLFMVLYEDVRAYSNWQREAVHFESQQLPYVKSPIEWEILGSVALRLGYRDQALAALHKSLELKFSHRAEWKLLDCYAPPDGKIIDVSEALTALVKLVAWNHRWYTEFSPRLSIVLRNIVATEGLLKVKNRLEAAYSRTDVMKIMNIELQRLQRLAAPGVDL